MSLLCNIGEIMKNSCWNNNPNKAIDKSALWAERHLYREESMNKVCATKTYPLTLILGPKICTFRIWGLFWPHSTIFDIKYCHLRETDLKNIGDYILPRSKKTPEPSMRVKILIVVIPKEWLAGEAPPILLLVWPRLCLDWLHQQRFVHICIVYSYHLWRLQFTNLELMSYQKKDWWGQFFFCVWQWKRSSKFFAACNWNIHEYLTLVYISLNSEKEGGKKKHWNQELFELHLSEKKISVPFVYKVVNLQIYAGPN